MTTFEMETCYTAPEIWSSSFHVMLEELHSPETPNDTISKTNIMEIHPKERNHPILV